MLNKSLGRIHELNKLSLQTRNRVRAILALDVKDSLPLLNRLRSEKNAKELMQIERVLRLDPLDRYSLLPEVFPKNPTTSESFHRLETIPYLKELQLIDGLAKNNIKSLQDFFSKINMIDNAIIEGDYVSASKQIAHLKDQFGYSHLLLRKCILLLTKAEDAIATIPEIESFLIDAGLEQNNIFLSSLTHCFNEEQDYLGLKRSILNLPKRGKINRFTRDMCRIAFHPYARDEDDFAELLQSCRQSSLIDAVIIAKVNHCWWSDAAESFQTLPSLNEFIDNNCTSVNKLASYYLSGASDGEYAFYKQSSAWLENPGVLRYRLLIDHFYDAPSDEHSPIPSCILRLIEASTRPLSLDELNEAPVLSQHAHIFLAQLEYDGTVTRSALFNYIINRTEGYTKISEDNLFPLMGKTRDLAKTVNPIYLSNLARVAETKRCRLILYFLIARRSKNELDDHTLRRILQDIVKSEHDGSLVSLFEELRLRSKEVADYAYEVCTEDFIAKLFKIIGSASEITETRAALHKWMGQITGEKVFLDRARTLLIDHQINKIRNEIDDNRIYVDAGRFTEWMNDEVMRDLNGVLSNTLHRISAHDSVDPQIVEIIERCFSSFCSNKIFGIASYLGRRIRHGTFKGHLYSSVVSIERSAKYRELLSEPNAMAVWEKWKRQYEAKIDEIIRTRLHIESTEKREGLLKPTIHDPSKLDAVVACARNLVRDFAETNSTLGTIPIMIEFCWRFAEFDLKSINAFLKNQKATLINTHHLNDLKLYTSQARSDVARDFCRDLTRSIDEKLIAMYNWFKKPVNVAPKASLSLLYKAVVAEVQTSFPDFNTDTEFDEQGDIELIGGAYHVIYDSMYVIVYNASKHGKPGASIERDFQLITGARDHRKVFQMRFTSAIKDEDSDEYVADRLRIDPNGDFTDAQVSEDRSGIKKLYHLSHCNSNFFIGNISAVDRKVNVELYYVLEH